MMNKPQVTSVETDRIMTIWSCHDCYLDTDVPLRELKHIGTPVCEECDEEMELCDTVGVFSQPI